MEHSRALFKRLLLSKYPQLPSRRLQHKDILASSLLIQQAIPLKDLPSLVMECPQLLSQAMEANHQLSSLAMGRLCQLHSLAMGSLRDRSHLLRPSMGKANSPQLVKEAMLSQHRCNLDILMLSLHRHNLPTFNRILVITGLQQVTVQESCSLSMGSHRHMVHLHQWPSQVMGSSHMALILMGVDTHKLLYILPTALWLLELSQLFQVELLKPPLQVDHQVSFNFLSHG